MIKQFIDVTTDVFNSCLKRHQSDNRASKLFLKTEHLLMLIYMKAMKVLFCSTSMTVRILIGIVHNQFFIGLYKRAEDKT